MLLEPVNCPPRAGLLSDLGARDDGAPLPEAVLSRSAPKAVYSCPGEKIVTAAPPDGLIRSLSKKRWFIRKSSNPSKFDRWNENGVLGGDNRIPSAFLRNIGKFLAFRKNWVAFQWGAE
jgi:hypothetical protein